MELEESDLAALGPFLTDLYCNHPYKRSRGMSPDKIYRPRRICCIIDPLMVDQPCFSCKLLSPQTPSRQWGTSFFWEVKLMHSRELQGTIGSTMLRWATGPAERSGRT